MAAIAGCELLELYGEELRRYRDEGLSWWAAREGLYEAYPSLQGRVSDHVMRRWYGGREDVQKKPAGAARRYGLNDLGRLWDWGLAKVAGDLKMTYRKLQRGLLVEHGIAAGSYAVERWRENLRAAAVQGRTDRSLKRGSTGTRRAKRLWPSRKGARKWLPRGSKNAERMTKVSFIRRRVRGRGEDRMVTMRLTSENGILVARGHKVWEGRPLIGPAVYISTYVRVCFKVGSRCAPWNVLCAVEDKEEYHTLDDMVAKRGGDLVPQVEGGEGRRVEYYKGLSPGYRKHAEMDDDTLWYRARWVAFRVKVIWA